MAFDHGTQAGVKPRPGTLRHPQVHGGGKRLHHEFRALYDFYGKRLDYGEGEYPSRWPSDVIQASPRHPSLVRLGRLSRRRDAMTRRAKALPRYPQRQRMAPGFPSLALRTSYRPT